MKKNNSQSPRLGFTLTILLLAQFLNGQPQQVAIRDPDYLLLSPFVFISSDKANVFQIALAQTKSDKDNYILLLENHVNDFGISLIDTTHLLDITMRAYLLKAKNGSTWMEEQLFTFPVFKKSINSNSQGIVIAFKLANKDAADVKGQKIGELILHSVDNSGKYRAETKSQVPVTDLSKNFFITYSSKINSKKGSFDDISKFKSNKIIFYSLYAKDIDKIEERLGGPFKTERTKFGVINYYTTEYGKYMIEFKENKSVKIEFIPMLKIKYLGRLFVSDSYPIEITGCNCGEYSSKATSGIFNEKRNDGVIYTFRDKLPHRINFYNDGIKYLEKVIVEEY
jgi:hypothetical protein